MIHNKKYNNNEIQISGDLKVGNEIVSIQTSEQWSGIEIDFSGKIQIKSLLPEDYMVSSGRNKIIIVKLNFKEESFSELFKYKGIANITKVLMVTKDLQSRILNIDMSSIQLWSNLIGYKKYGEDFTFDKIEVSGQGIVNIRRRVNGTLSYLRKKINRAGANALDSDKQALNTMIEFKGQFDELFIGAYGDLQLLQELNGVDRTWSRTLAPMIHSEFAYDIGKYGRSLAKGDLSDYGSNRLYGLGGSGVDPIEWSDTMLNMIHNDPVKAARYFNFQFGQEITLANGSKAYKIVDPKMQKAVARILNGAIERNAKKFGERYFKELDLRTTVGDRKLKAPDSSIIDNLANERIFQEQLMIPKGSSYMNVTSTAQTPRRIYIGEQQLPFDTSSSALYEKNIK